MELGSAVPDADDGDETGGHQPRKRQKKQVKKEYIPGVGTANYAFMIALFQVRCFILIHALLIDDLKPSLGCKWLGLQPSTIVCRRNVVERHILQNMTS